MSRPLVLVLAIVSVVAFVALATATGLFSSIRGGAAPNAVAAPGPPFAGQGARIATDRVLDRAAARRVLSRWDALRSSAWAKGDVAALEALYVPGSSAGAADVAMLRSWRDKGMRVEGMAMQVLAFELLEREEDTIVVTVTDRLVSGIAVGGGTRVRLPADRAEQRTITLRRVVGQWLVDAVT